MSEDHGNDKNDRLQRLQVISKKELLKLIPYSDQHILRLEKARKFPSRMDLGDNRVGWLLADIEEWIKTRKIRTYNSDGDGHAP